ncbi:MAG: hypothetical protein V4696_01545 [Pseudomonadota bacterium]
MQAKGPTTVILHFDAARTSALRESEVQHLTYHVTRLLIGERTAESEWRHLGIAVELDVDSDGGPE